MSDSESQLLSRKKFHISSLHDKKDGEKGLDCLIISRDMEMTCTKLNYKSFSCCEAASVCVVERACLSEGKKGKKLDSGKVSQNDDDVVQQPDRRCCLHVKFTDAPQKLPSRSS